MKEAFTDKKKKSLRAELKTRTLGYITAAFGLVAGLAWNDAIRALIEYWFPLKQNSVLAKFGYALLVTLLLVLVSIYLINLFKDEGGDSSGDE